jgi:hypothetical protein
MPSSKCVTPYEYVAKNIYIVKICKKCKKNKFQEWKRPYHGIKELSSKTKCPPSLSDKKL